MRGTFAAAVQGQLEAHPRREGVDLMGDRIAVGEEDLGADLHDRQRGPEGEPALLDLEGALGWRGVNLAIVEQDEFVLERAARLIEQEELDRGFIARRRRCDEQRRKQGGGEHKMMMITKGVRRVSAAMGVVMGPQHVPPRLSAMSPGYVVLLFASFAWRNGAAADDEALLQQLFVSPPQVTTALAYRTYVPPEYPREAWRRGLEGWVDVELTIGADGRVVDARVVSSQPRGIFERAALRAVVQWVFDPAAAGEGARTGIFRVDFRRDGG